MPRADDAEGDAKPTLRRFEFEMPTATQRLLDRVAATGRIDDGWGDEYAEAKAAEIAAQGDEAWE